jgi:hypothetical protein
VLVFLRFSDNVRYGSHVEYRRTNTESGVGTRYHGTNTKKGNIGSRETRDRRVSRPLSSPPATAAHTRMVGQMEW